ncbi:Lrp/AsnC family transcriptional regulator [Halorarum salinum]|nr:Lrp/AsnC family transcriptional regulator [Halobaculum salinum]
MSDARNTSAPMIAEEVNVSPGTIRNRIDLLESHGIIRGYGAVVDFERADGRLSNLYMCNVPVSERETLAQEARAVPGVVNVRELMTGRRNLHVLAVGEDTGDLRRISRALSALGIEIEDEDLVQNEEFDAYSPFGPADSTPSPAPTDFISLAGGADVVEVTVRADAPITGHTLEEVGKRGVIDDQTLIIAIERDDAVLTPRGGTTIRSDDVVTVLSRGGDREGTLDAFLGTDDS